MKLNRYCWLLWICGAMLLFARCRKPVMPADFNFSLVFYNHDEVSSYNSTFKRAFVLKDSVIRVTFSDDEKRAVFESVTRNHFAKLPGQLHTNGGTCIVPFATDYLKITMNGITKKVAFYDRCDKKNNQITSFLI